MYFKKQRHTKYAIYIKIANNRITIFFLLFIIPDSLFIVLLYIKQAAKPSYYLFKKLFEQFYYDVGNNALITKSVRTYAKAIMITPTMV